MPKDKDFKARVRARMAATGERYTQARQALDTRPRPEPPPAVALGWVEDLGRAGTYLSAYERLRQLPAELVRALAVGATRSPDWRVRRGGCRLLDDLDFTAESYAALRACLEDPEPPVRRAAVHSLLCQTCKPNGCVVDIRGAVESGLRDPSRRVREMALRPLLYGDEEPWRLDLLGRVAEEDPSPRLRAEARLGLANFEARRRSDTERRRLPLPLRTTTDRHPGRWVAVSDGRVINVGGHPGALERTARRHGHGDVRLYWVAPN